MLNSLGFLILTGSVLPSQQSTSEGEHAVDPGRGLHDPLNVSTRAIQLTVPRPRSDLPTRVPPEVIEARV